MIRLIPLLIAMQIGTDTIKNRVLLVDPPLDLTVRGADVLIRRNSNGAYYQGTVNAVSATEITIDKITIPIDDIAGTITLRPARAPASPGDQMTALSRKGASTTGTVVTIDLSAVALQTTNGIVQFRWNELAFVDVAPAPQRVEAERRGYGISPIPIAQPLPEYPKNAPPDASAAVIVEATLGETGALRDVIVISGTEPFASATRDAVSQWRYRPIVINGERTALVLQIRFAFEPPRYVTYRFLPDIRTAKPKSAPKSEE